MKEVNKSLVILALLMSLSMVLSGCGGGDGAEGVTPSLGGADYVGTWMREDTFVDGSPQGSAPATLVLTKSSFSSSTSLCSLSGSISAQGNMLLWTVEESNCPGPVGVGTVSTYTYSVSGGTLTIINTEYGAEVKEVYKKS